MLTVLLVNLESETTIEHRAGKPIKITLNQEMH
jgi:hypothetical protein